MTLSQNQIIEFANVLRNTDPNQYKSLIELNNTDSYVPVIESFLQYQSDDLKKDKVLIERFFSFLSTLLLIDSLSKQIEISNRNDSPSPLLTKKIAERIYQLRNYYVHNISLYE